MGHRVRGIARRKLFPAASELGILSVDKSKALTYMSSKDRKKDNTHTGNDGVIIKLTKKKPINVSNWDMHTSKPINKAKGNVQFV